MEALLWVRVGDCEEYEQFDSLDDADHWANLDDSDKTAVEAGLEKNYL